MLLYLVAIVHCFSLIQGYQFHQYITDEEIEQIFKPEHDSVPEYDIVTINFSRIQKRSADSEPSHSLSFRAFNKTLRFDFEQNENLLMGKNTPLYIANTQNRITLAGYNADIFAYHDVNNRAAIITAPNRNGQLEVHGTLGDDMYIRPINTYLNNMKSDTINRLRKFSKRSVYDLNKIFDGNQHIVVKQKNQFNKNAYGVLEKIPTSAKTEESKNINKREVVDIVYPKLLVSVDYDLFKSKNLDPDNLMKYIFAVYNSVDLRFRTLESPKVRLSIRLVVAEGTSGALPYYTNDTTDASRLNIHNTLNAMGKYFWKNTAFALLNQDVSVGLIGRADVGMSDEKQNWFTGVLGIAYLGGACKHDAGGMDSAVVVAIDRGDFATINVITHELGHVFGAAHDGDPNNPENCVDPRHMMFPMATRISEDFSVCSQKQLHDYMTSTAASCLREKPTMREPFPVLFPGQIVKSLDEQCQELYPNSRARIETDVEDFPCNTLRCEVTREDESIIVWDIDNGALDGTACNDDQGICMFGDCIPVKASIFATK